MLESCLHFLPVRELGLLRSVPSSRYSTVEREPSREFIPPTTMIPCKIDTVSLWDCHTDCSLTFRPLKSTRAQPCLRLLCISGGPWVHVLLAGSYTCT